MYPPRHATGLLRVVSCVACCFFLILIGILPVCGQTVSTLAGPLLLPTSVTFDAQGNLYITETNLHVIRRLNAAGVLTTVAGNGTQGFAGDGGPALAAELDSPAGIAVDSANDLYIADAHNHRIRKVDGVTGVISTVAGNGSSGFGGDGGPARLASLDLPSALAVDMSGDLYIADTNNHRIRKVTIATGMITTVAGDGLQEFSGDGGLATRAAIDSPGGVAVDSAGNIYIADTHNQRIRMVKQTTGVITTIAGIGVAGFGGDNGAGVEAALALPRGVSVDAAGNLYVADSNNQRIRRISADGTITTIAGEGVQVLAGDGELATAAGLDTPRATALSPAGLLTIADTGSGRVRQVSLGDTGTGSTAPGILTLTVPPTLTYGSGSLIAAFSGGDATGSITFFDGVASGATVLGTVVLANNVATLGTASLAVGVHHIFSVYSGDSTHASTQSATSMVSVSAAQVRASAVSASMLYGQQIPALAGSLSGVLPQDAGKVSLVLSTAAAALSPVGAYPIVGALSGEAAGNYALTPLAGVALTIDKAPSTVTLSVSSLSAAVGSPVSAVLHVASTTSGTPTGSVMLLDGGVPLASLPLSSTGSASFTSSALALGAHALTVTYAGDGNFMGSSTAVQTVSVTPVISGNFALTTTGTTSQTINWGSSASFPFAVQMQGPDLASPIALAVSGLPTRMTATFDPAYLPPGGAVMAFTLTIQTEKAVADRGHPQWLPESFVGLAILLPFVSRWRRRWAGIFLLATLMVMVGCGDRVVSTANSSASIASYSITVSGTATGPAGAVLQHTATVMLQMQ